MADASKKEEVIEVPEKYDDPIMEWQHMAQKGENIVTCKTIIKDPQDKIGQDHRCVDCGMTFKVIREKPPVVTKDSGSPA